MRGVDKTKNGNIRPKILLIGTGGFGKKHLRVLNELNSEGLIKFVGIVSRNEKTRQRIKLEHGLQVFSEINTKLLKDIDAVVVATPPETHFALVKKCLEHTNVFVEKPLSLREKEALHLQQMAQKHNRILMVGHIFRFNAVTKKLKEIVPNDTFPKEASGAFINPMSTDKGREPSLELLHLFDVIDYLWDIKPKVIYSESRGRLSEVDLRYSKNFDAHLVMGWQGTEKKRSIKFQYEDSSIEADFIKEMVIHKQDQEERLYPCPNIKEPLKEEHLSFIRSIQKIGDNPVNALEAARVVSIAERAVPKMYDLPSVAVIGGGIFGASIAAELGNFCKVKLFEKNSELMQEGSFINQFRHHYGYHYPRSDETVVDVQRSRPDFEVIFKDALIDTVPTYYALAKQDSLVSRSQFLDFCRRHKLPFKETFPNPDLLSVDLMDLCVKVPEPSYHHEKLKNIAEERIESSSNVDVCLNTTVMGCSMNKEGIKKLTYVKDGSLEKGEQFDFVINATYANINRFAEWLDFEKYPIRIDLAEVLILKLPIPPISLTVIDGPFATLMPTGRPNEFTLYHVKESIIDRYVPQDGILKEYKKPKSNQERILKESLNFFPILHQAEVVESRMVNRGVRAHHEHDDARMADLVMYGFGCWSILSGKIVSSVTVAKDLANLIKPSLKRGGRKVSSV